MSYYTWIVFLSLLIIISAQILEFTDEEYHPNHTYTPVSSLPLFMPHRSIIYQCMDIVIQSIHPIYLYFLYGLVNGSVLFVTDVVLAGDEGHFSRLFPQSSCCH